MYSAKEVENTGMFQHFNDNGLFCDGALLCEAADVDADELASLEASGLGAVVDGMAANDDAMLKVLRMAPLADGEDLEEYTVGRMQEAADTMTAAWAHYGAYGAGDSTWIFLPLPTLGE